MPTVKSNKKLILLLSANTFIFIFIGAYFWIGTVISSQEQRKIEQFRQQIQFRFPRPPQNASAVELEKLVVNLDIVRPSEKNHKLNDKNKKIYSDLMNYLRNFYDLSNNQDQIESPSSLREYLVSNSSTIDEIRNHLIKNEIPFWNREKGERITSDDSLFSRYNLREILLAEILEETRAGNSKMASETLLAYWKLRQSDTSLDDKLYPFNYPEEMIARRINSPPSEWHKYLKIDDYYWDSFLEVSSFYTPLNFHLGLSPNCRNRIRLERNNFECKPDFYDSFEQQILKPLLAPYSLIITVNTLERNQQNYSKISREEICAVPAEALEQKLIQKFKTNSFWIDNFSKSAQSEKSSFYEFYAALIDRELTQKVLQVKEIAAKTGTIPISIPGIENSWACPNLRWNYKVVDRKVTISLQGQPGWINPRNAYSDNGRYNYNFQL